MSIWTRCAKNSGRQGGPAGDGISCSRSARARVLEAARGSRTYAGDMGDDLLLDVLRRRWSPREFDPGHELSDPEEAALLEAARWAPSAGNSQPWAFHVVRRGAKGWPELLETLTGGSRAWAAQASALIVNIAHVTVEGSDWEYSEFSVYDLGQAVAHLTIQAHAMGLACRQFRAFDKEGLTRLLAVPDHWEIVTMTAVGHAAPAAQRSLGANVCQVAGNALRSAVAGPPTRTGAEPSARGRRLAGARRESRHRFGGAGRRAGSTRHPVRVTSVRAVLGSTLRADRPGHGGPDPRQHPRSRRARPALGPGQHRATLRQRRSADEPRTPTRRLRRSDSGLPGVGQGEVKGSAPVARAQTS